MREKRAILARWLARICASEAALGLKWMPQADGASVGFDDVMDALQALERGAGRTAASATMDTSLPCRPYKSAGTVH